MAYFNYDAKYNGRSCATGLSREILQAIKEARESGELNLKESTHPEFVVAYKYLLDENNFVRFGVTVYPGKAAGTEEVQFQFSGTENNNLRAKSDLLEKIVGLELE